MPVAGATVKEVKQLWCRELCIPVIRHGGTVHGEIKGCYQRTYVNGTSDDDLHCRPCLTIPIPQLFVLNGFTGKKQYEENYARIGEIWIQYSVGAYVRCQTWTPFGIPKTTKLLWEEFSKVDINSRSLLLDHFHMHQNRYLKILRQMKAMTSEIS
jgi:hypothetical protein